MFNQGGLVRFKEEAAFCTNEAQVKHSALVVAAWSPCRACGHVLNRSALCVNPTIQFSLRHFFNCWKRRRRSSTCWVSSTLEIQLSS